ncbi:hypothetical protein, partial [Massilia mucilaginosa]|uniref:hypothetical protein n=1 Tax=Massilia mucilaginosa TaxID=2609282 RepID=UPI001CB758AF
DTRCSGFLYFLHRWLMRRGRLLAAEEVAASDGAASIAGMEEDIRRRRLQSGQEMLSTHATKFWQRHGRPWREGREFFQPFTVFLKRTVPWSQAFLYDL